MPTSQNRSSPNAFDHTNTAQTIQKTRCLDQSTEDERIAARSQLRLLTLRDRWDGHVVATACVVIQGKCGWHQRKSGRNASEKRLGEGEASTGYFRPRSRARFRARREQVVEEHMPEDKPSPRLATPQPTRWPRDTSSPPSSIERLRITGAVPCSTLPLTHTLLMAYPQPDRVHRSACLPHRRILPGSISTTTHRMSSRSALSRAAAIPRFDEQPLISSETKHRDNSIGEPAPISRHVASKDLNPFSTPYREKPQIHWICQGWLGST